MRPTLDQPTTIDTAPVQTGGVTRMASHHNLPDIHYQQKRRLHPTIIAGIGFLGASCAFYGAQMFAPASLKPSTVIGAYDTQIQEARKAGELSAQVRYDAQVRGIELQYQGQLKQIETAAVQWQEQYKTTLQGYLNYYQATYNRANIFAQATADLQKQYASARYQVVQGTLGGETGMANLATMVGLFGGLFDPEFGRQSMEVAEAARQQALSKLDAAARGGVTISVDGWNDGLVDPTQMAQAINGLPPLQLPGFRPMPIGIPNPINPPAVRTALASH